MALETVNILDGNTFVVSDRRGDLDATPAETHGLFLNDTRFLSRWVLTINGIRPTLLSVDDQAYYRVQFFLALATGTVYVDSHLSVVRRRAIGDGFQEEIEIVNHDKKPVDLDIRLEAGADFADLFEVKDKLAKKGTLYRSVEGGRLTLGYRRESFQRETLISSSVASDLDEGGLAFHVRVAPQSSWKTRVDVKAAFEHAVGGDGRKAAKKSGATDGDAFAETEARLGRSVEEWIAGAPRLVASWRPLHTIYRRSLVDLAALRFPFVLTPGTLPAAGLPWFMAAFGRDSLITSFQALTFRPDLAAATLRALALFQGRTSDPFRDEEPGKILHEVRLGEMTAFEERPHSPYYGASDSTTLFLILLEAYDRWTGDHALARELEHEARAALAWIDAYGDRDGDGYIEYERRNAKTGLDNQCWKDSWDSIAFADGTLAPTPRATCELQGYAYDAKCRAARLAREVWNDPTLAGALERSAEALKQRFNRDFWIPERGFFALALDGQKRKVDSLTSNIGHLLWSGIADDDKAASCVR
ncbi:MAG TPA: glycogen debranching N-terminal domain-containing protein, partial [Polyangia bacterium]|nr:glycogen debranching N-terminal domain-containing protein [Polyangia bacterium]